MNELKTIREIVEKIFEVEINNTRNRNVVEAKAAYCYLANRYTNCTLREIAKGAGLSNHATAFHHIKNTRAMIDIYPQHAEMVERCESKLISLGMTVSGKRDPKKRYDLAMQTIRKRLIEIEKMEKELFGEVRTALMTLPQDVDLDKELLISAKLAELQQDSKLNKTLINLK